MIKVPYITLYNGVMEEVHDDRYMYNVYINSIVQSLLVSTVLCFNEIE